MIWQWKLKIATTCILRKWHIISFFKYNLCSIFQLNSYGNFKNIIWFTACNSRTALPGYLQCMRWGQWWTLRGPPQQQSRHTVPEHHARQTGPEKTSGALCVCMVCMGSDVMLREEIQLVASFKVVMSTTMSHYYNNYHALQSASFSIDVIVCE